MRVSFVIPAWNEAPFIGKTVKHLRAAATRAGCEDAEIIVADDGSTDDTAELARQAGARVVPAGRRIIAATRNAGARASSGEALIFIDADTRPSSEAIAGAFAALRDGAVGGGAVLAWDGPVSFGGRLGLWGWTTISRLLRLPAGGFFFARRDAWEAAGGFPEDVLVSEEIWLGWRLHKLGRVVILGTPVTTSARKLRIFGTFYHLRLLLRILVRPRETIRDRAKLDLWYRR